MSAHEPVAGGVFPQPGDIAVVSTGTRTTGLIRFAEDFAAHFRHATEWDHAVIATGYAPSGQLMIVEAEPSGAREVVWHYDSRPFRWSTGILPPCPEAGPAARRYVGTPYSWADYAAIGLHSCHVPAPGLRGFIADSGHMICSQLADQSRRDGGSRLFADGRWPGYVTPLDLGLLLGA